jgi:transposase-like protein
MSQTHEDCLVFLEKLRWKGIPTCPYCGSQRSTAYKKEKRYRCQYCFTSYSVTVGTVFHKTHVDLNKWFRLISLVNELNGRMSDRKLAKELEVSRSTVALMLKRIQEASHEEAEMLRAILCPDISLM